MARKTMPGRSLAHAARLWRVPRSRFLVVGRFPAVGRRLPFWQFPRPSNSGSHERRAASGERQATRLPASGAFPVPCSLFPVPGRWLFPALGQMTNDEGPMTVILHSALRTRNSFARLGLQKQRTQGDCKSFFRLDLQKQVSPCFRFPVPRSLFPAFGSYPQRRMPMRPC